MRFNINLASQKYQDVRQFYIRWGTALAAALVLTAVLATLTVLQYSSAKESTKRIRQLKQKITALEKDRAAAEAVENSPENRDVKDQKNYWNAQIAKRVFSWTQLFNDLQKTMPGRAYVISIAPELTPDNRLKLKLAIGAEKYEGAIDLVKRMEKNPSRFQHPQITTQTVQKDPRTGTNLIKLEIETFYTPAGITPAHPTAKEGM
jgi:Tfp pilus assembly protein PilN